MVEELKSWRWGGSTLPPRALPGGTLALVAYATIPSASRRPIEYSHRCGSLPQPERWAHWYGRWTRRGEGNRVNGSGPAAAPPAATTSAPRPSDVRSAG